MSLKQFKPIAAAIQTLLHPYAEVVLHDLKTHTIRAIYHPISQRAPGDDSLLDLKESFETQEIIGPYEKRNIDGRVLKSISAVLRDHNNLPVGLLCINLDISKLTEAHRLLSLFMGINSNAQNTEPLFKDDWQERINSFVHQYLAENHLSLETLSRDGRRNLVHALEKDGAFKGKHAAGYAAKVLGISRATVYKYLNLSQ